MSLLIVEVLPHGMIFAADRAVTVTKLALEPNRTTTFQGQELGSKVLKWPHDRGLIGYVGLGQIDDQSTYDWLFDFIGDHVNFSNPEQVASDLRDSLQRAVGGTSPPEGLIVEFGAFTKRNGISVPQMWHVTNIHGINNEGEYDPPTNTFGASEEILGKWMKDVPAAEVRTALETGANAHDPAWFHQGINLVIFNTLERGVKAAFKSLHQAGRLGPPQSLEDWERHARMWVLIFGAYYEAFGDVGERFVGGGADVVSIPWPTLAGADS